jgi:hypothetical protein
LQSAILDYQAITDQLKKDLQLEQVVEIPPILPLICSSLDFAPKPNRGLQQIYYLLYLLATSVNTNINPNFLYLQYIKIADVTIIIVAAGCYSTIIKRDIKDTFRNIPLVLYIQ